MKDVAIVAAICMLVLIGLLWTLERAIRFRRMATCKHLARVRFWLPRHAFVVKCKACGMIVERGRDITHFYPDEVRRRRA